MQRGIFEPSREDVTGDYNKLHTEELHNLDPFQNLLRRLNQEEKGTD
jgi:hypothetical protein